MVIVSMFQVLSQVAFPVFSRARGEPERMRRGYLRMVRLQTAYGVVLGCVLAAVAPYLTPVVFGPGWTPSVFPLQALAIYAAFRSLGMGVVDVLKAVGRPTLALGLSVARFAVLLPALVLATAYGIDGVAVAQVAVALVFAVVMQLAAGRLLRIRVVHQLAACAPAVSAGVASAACAALVAALAPGGDVVKLLWGLATAAVVASGVLALSPGTRRDLRSLIPRRVATDRGA
jgi:lipopolysaccharide exporter